MNFRSLSVLVGIFFLFQSTYAANITGTVKDKEGKAVVSATVILLNAAEKTLAKTTLTDESGSFVLEGIKEGNYNLKITMLGYQEFGKDGIEINSTDVDAGAIVLSLKSTKLKEVTVRSKKPLIEVYADKLVVNVENSIMSAGSSVMDVLSTSPTVSVDNNDNISIKGKQGVNVMIDGKRMVLSGTDLANMLKSTPADNISQIEVISNPGAKYDAEGTGGIINIIRKKNKSTGFNGSFNTSYAQGVYPKAGIGFNINYGSKKIRTYVSYNYGYRAFFNRLKLDRKFFDNQDAVQFSYLQDNFMKMGYQSHTGTFGLDYVLSDKTILGVAGTAGTTGFSPNAYNTSSARNGNDDVLYYFNTEGHHRQDYYNYSANLNLRHNFDDKGKQLSVDADYARYWNQSNQNFETVYLNPDGTNYQPNYYMKSDLVGITQIQSVKADYALPLKAKAKFEAGAKASYVTSDNEPLFYEKTLGDYKLDVKRSNHFVYKENINAAYVNYNKHWQRPGRSLRCARSPVRRSCHCTCRFPSSSKHHR